MNMTWKRWVFCDYLKNDMIELDKGNWLMGFTLLPGRNRPPSG
jgi:hypothetical protein